MKIDNVHGGCIGTLAETKPLGTLKVFFFNTDLMYRFGHPKNYLFSLSTKSDLDHPKTIQFDSENDNTIQGRVGAENDDFVFKIKYNCFWAHFMSTLLF